MGWIEPITLWGKIVELVPLEIGHVDALKQVAADGELWKLWFTTVPSPESTEAYVDTALAERAAGRSIPFVARRRGEGKMVGCTRYMNIEAAHRRLEIGSTWYAGSVQRTAVNTE